MSTSPVDRCDHAFVVLDHGGAILLQNRLAEMLARPDGDVEEGQRLTALVQAEDGGDLEVILSRVAADESESAVPSVRVTAPSGTEAPLRLTVYRLDEERLVGVLSSPRPTETEMDLSAASPTPLRDAWAALRDAMALASAGDDRTGPRILAVNDAFCGLFGLTQEEAEGRELAPFLAPDDGSQLLDVIRRQVVGEGQSLTDVSVLQGASRGPTLVEWEVAPVRSAEGEVRSLIAVVGDARSSTMSRPIHRSMDVDPLTGMPNHLQFMSRLERTLERASQSRLYGFAIVALETERLAEVERRLGSELSNAVLEALVWRVERCLRPGDLVARIGRDRLAVLLDYFSPQGSVERVLDRIAEATDAPYTIAGEKVWLSTVGAAGPVYDGGTPPKTAREILDGLELLSVRPTDHESRRLHARDRTSRPSDRVEGE